MNRPAAQARVSAASITDAGCHSPLTTSTTDSRAYPCHPELANARLAVRLPPPAKQVQMSRPNADEASLQPSSPLTNLQLELLRLYGTDLADEELEEVRKLLARFIAQKAVREADRVWDERGLTNEDMDAWLDASTRRSLETD